MAMTEDDIRKLTKAPNTDYYLSAFNKIEEAGESTWNWAAFFGGTLWLNYRKMYLLGLLFFLLPFFVFFAALTATMIFYKITGLDITEGYYEALGTIFIISIIVFHCLLGLFGNNIYYRRIKKNIKKGYHLCDKYNPTSVVILLFPFVSFVAWLVDKIILFKALKSKEAFDSDLSECNIRLALSQKSENYYVKKFKKIESGKKISLNWAAFFGGSFWFAYRGMYLYGVLFFILKSIYFAVIFGIGADIFSGANKDALLLLV